MLDRRTHLDLSAMALLALLCLLWGLQQVSIKLANEGVSPVMQAGIRSIGATALLWIWMTLRGQKLLERDKSLIPGLIAGTLFAVEFLCIYWGLSYTTASRSIIFIYTAPFVVALGAQLFLPHEKLRLLQAMGLGCAFLGIVIAFADGWTLASPTMLYGDLLALAGAVLWGATTVLVKATVLARISPAKTLFYQLAVSALALVPASILMGEPGITMLSPLVVGCLLFQTVIVAFASYLAWFWLVAHYPAARLASFTFLTPLFGLAAGGIILSEPITPLLLAALALVAAGIWLVNRPGETKC
ncbi:putative permease (Drug-metabolite transporter DMT family) [Rhodospirillaceae bacterium LM-1]|nr:putative permease (Drug-metabolite transporter DMT family) [Rhodospirillaceae bacterium LM-1]